MSYEFIMNDQNKIIFENALTASKKLLDLVQKNYDNHQKFVSDDSCGEKKLADNLPFFQNLYDWLYLLQNQKSISLTKENFLNFKKDYRGYSVHLNIFLDAFQEVQNINNLKLPKNLKQQAMLTYHYNSQIIRKENQQEKEIDLSLMTPLFTNKINPK